MKSDNYIKLKSVEHKIYYAFLSIFYVCRLHLQNKLVRYYKKEKLL